MVQIKTLPFRRIANVVLALASTAVTLFAAGYAHAAIPITERAVLLDIYTAPNAIPAAFSAGRTIPTGTVYPTRTVGAGVDVEKNGALGARDSRVSVPRRNQRHRC